MPCCSRKKTDGRELQSIKAQSDQSSEKMKTTLPLKNSSIDREIEYLIAIKTGEKRYANTDGPVYIKIFERDDTQTNEILLTGLFQQDSIDKVQIKAIDIGKPE